MLSASMDIVRDSEAHWAWTSVAEQDILLLCIK